MATSVLTASGSNYNTVSGTVTISSSPQTGLAVVTGQRDVEYQHSGSIYLNGGTGQGMETLYPEMFVGNNSALWFHISIWEMLCGDNFTDYAILGIARGAHETGVFASEHLLVFGSKRSRLAFRRWWKRYRKLFDGDSIEKDFVPIARSSKRIKGAVINFEIPSHTNAMRDVWSWIVSNSRARVWRVPHAFIFANDVDAVAFKLKWC